MKAPALTQIQRHSATCGQPRKWVNNSASSANGCPATCRSLAIFRGYQVLINKPCRQGGTHRRSRRATVASRRSRRHGKGRGWPQAGKPFVLLHSQPPALLPQVPRPLRQEPRRAAGMEKLCKIISRRNASSRWDACSPPQETQSGSVLLRALSETSSVKFAGRKPGSCLRSPRPCLGPAAPAPQPLSPFSQLMPFQKPAHAIKGTAL